MMRGRTRIVGQDDIKITVEVPNSVDPTKPHRIDLPDIRDYYKWESGAHVQVAFPYLDAATREVFITGIGGEDFARMFPAEDDEDGPHTDADAPPPTAVPFGTPRRDIRSFDQRMKDMEHINEYFNKDNPK